MGVAGRFARREEARAGRRLRPRDIRTRNAPEGLATREAAPDSEASLCGLSVCVGVCCFRCSLSFTHTHTHTRTRTRTRTHTHTHARRAHAGSGSTPSWPSCNPSRRSRALPMQRHTFLCGRAIARKKRLVHTHTHTHTLIQLVFVWIILCVCVYVCVSVLWV